MMIDVLIQNAEIVDGTNGPRYRGDIAIEGSRIADIGSLGEAAAETVIEAAGRVVVPGFIDMHSHTDLALLVEPEAESLVRQGITTVVTGQCGISPAPLTQEHRKDAVRMVGMLVHSQVSMPWDQLSSFESFLSYLEQMRPSVHVVPLVGHAMIRAAVWGYRADRPDPDRIERMQRLAHKAMDCGAFGIALLEMVRVTRPGGRIVVAEPDWETFILAANDEVVTRKMMNLVCDAFKQRWIGRHLPPLFRELGLADITVVAETLLFSDYSLVDQVWGLQTIVECAQAAGIITAKEGAGWLRDLDQRNQTGRFFSSVTGFIVVGRKR